MGFTMEKQKYNCLSDDLHWSKRLGQGPGGLDSSFCPTCILNMHFQQESQASGKPCSSQQEFELGCPAGT